MASIELRELTKRYADGTEAVSGLSLDIADGEFMILVGPSGCGKTTALRMIAGLEDISDGELRIGDEVVNGLSPKARDIAMVFQSYALYPHMTVRENLAFSLRLAKVPRPEVEERVTSAAAILDLTDHLDRRPARLSGGQRQRVAMGRAIVRSPQAFLMDEPLSNLDARLRVQMRIEIARLQARLGTTTVYVTHDQTEAMTLGDRVAVMSGGVLQQVDTPRMLYERPVNLFVAGFIGSPPMNLLPGRITGDDVDVPVLGTLPIPPGLRAATRASRHGGDVVVGVRPERFEDAALGPGRPGRVRLRAHVDLVETLGAERFAYLALPQSADGASLVARVSGESLIEGGASAEFTLDPADIHVFDAKTGVSLTRPVDSVARRPSLAVGGRV